jgi:uncharacterized ferritin-like protein (DUF455 family)
MRAPPPGTVERWAWDYVLGSTLEGKLRPPPVPVQWDPSASGRRSAEDGRRETCGTEGSRGWRLEAPGRPSELRVVARAEKTRGLGSPTGRARALHTFFHHELQAAELMAWALLAFADAPREFRAGLVRIALDEIRHMHLYANAIARLGHSLGDFVVRDWFWERVPQSVDAASFVAVMGLGVESANLEHARAWTARFRDVGDEESARVQEIVGREEIAHVRFGARWFSFFRGGLDFDVWRRALPPPLTPLLMRGRPLHREARRRAGQSEPFLDALDAWQPEEPGS